MWLVFNSDTGAIVAPPQPDEPTPGPGQSCVRVPGSAMTDPPGTVWSPTARGYTDAPVLTTRAFLMLWTPAEVLAIRATTSADLAYFHDIALASPVIHLADSRVIAGVGYALAAGVIDAARQAQILANQAPG